MTDPLEPFDSDLLEDVAASASSSIDTAALSSLLECHQRRVRELPGVENLVYEWRRRLPDDPLVERTEDAYHLVVRPGVWAEFADDLGMTDAERTALQTVHDRQARRDARARNDPETAFDGGAPILIVRT